jgi:hypothetical protein
MTKSNVPDFMRTGSATALLFTLLSDEKVHKLTEIKQRLVKAGIKPTRTRSLIFRLDRILRTESKPAMQCNSSKRTNTIMMFKQANFTAAKAAIARAATSTPTTKVVAKAKPVKHVAKKIAKHVTKKHVAKPSTKIAVAAGVDDDDVLEA